MRPYTFMLDSKMKNIVKIITFVSILLLSGCGRYLYVRDTNGIPVSGARMYMISDRMKTEHEFGKTNDKGESLLSIQVPGVLEIIARKPGYHESRSKMVNDNVIIFVMVPE
jgi:hypothetical protein